MSSPCATFGVEWSKYQVSTRGKICDGALALQIFAPYLKILPLNDDRLCEYAVGSVLLTLVAGLAAIILLGRRQKVGRMSDSAVALSHLLAGQGRPEEERTAEGRALDGIFEENTADIKSDFRRAQEPYLRAHQTLNGSLAERLLDYAEVNAPQAAALVVRRGVLISRAVVVSPRSLASC